MYLCCSRLYHFLCRAECVVSSTQDIVVFDEESDRHKVSIALLARLMGAKEHADKKLKDKEDRMRRLQESLSKSDMKVTELAQAEQASGKVTGRRRE